MISIPVDATLRTRLAAVRETVIVRAEDGTVLGYFSPVGRPADDDLARVLAGIDIGELRRRKVAAGKWRTTDEVLGSLRDASPQ